MPTLAQQAYVQLRAKLAAGEFPPGRRLVNRAISKSIGMSMTPVREAVARLASEGIIQHIPGAGAFVRTISHQELAQLYDLREVLEPFAAAEAATHMTANELDELRRVCDDWRAIYRQMRRADQPHATQEQMARWLENDHRFHALIFSAARNVWLTKMAGDLQLLAFGFNPQRSVPEFLTTENARNTLRDHLRVLRALENRDAALARRIVKRHIRIGRKRVLEFLDSQRAHSAHSDHAPLPTESA